jgi:hypothetical protein
LTFDKKYEDEDLYVCFKDGGHGPWYMYNHADLLKKVLPQIERTKTWLDGKPYHYPVLSEDMKKLLEPYRIPE